MGVHWKSDFMGDHKKPAYWWGLPQKGRLRFKRGLTEKELGGAGVF